MKNKVLLPKNKKYLLTCYVCICVIYSLTYDGANINYKGILNITTIEEVIFKTMKNDISFVMDGKFVLLVEHQSSINNNMCLRDLIYITEVIRQMIDPKDLYKEAPVKIPTPAFVMLYNGERHMPAYHEMKLLDAYMAQEGECSLQLIIRVYK